MPTAVNAQVNGASHVLSIRHGPNALPVSMLHESPVSTAPVSLFELPLVGCAVVLMPVLVDSSPPLVVAGDGGNIPGHATKSAATSMRRIIP